MTGLGNVALNAWGGGNDPISLVHFITERCNARCAHCFIDFADAAAPAPELSVEEIEAIARSLARVLVNVNITGGEPFLNQRIWPICRAWLRGAGVASVYVTTHGGFTERIEALARQFLASGLDGHLFVSISIDNFAAAHDRNRRVDGLFARALASHARLKAFNDERLGVGVAITVAEHNHGQVLDLYRALRDEHGVDVVSATLRRAEGVAAALAPELQARVGSAYAGLTRAIEADLARQPRSGARRSLVARVQDAKDGLLYSMLREDAVAGSRYRSSCPAGGLFVVVRPDGDVNGCEMRGDSRLGNVRDYALDLRRLLAAPAAGAWRQAVRSGRCHCSYECALGINIVGHLRYLPRLAAGLIRGVGNG